MKHIWKYLSLVCYELAAAIVIWTVFKGTAGFVAACVFLAVVTLILIVAKVENNDIKCPLLVDLLILSANFALLHNEYFWPLTVPMGLGAAFDIINRVANKTYNTESVSAFLKSEFRLPADLEIILVLFIVIGAWEEKGFGNPIVWIVLALVLADFVRQKFLKKRLVK